MNWHIAICVFLTYWFGFAMAVWLQAGCGQ